MLFTIGFIGFMVFAAIDMLGLGSTAPYEFIGSCGLGFAFGMVIIGMIFTGRNASKIRSFKMRLLGKDGEKAE